ncbi:hypothetical protein IQ273_25755 [Nodosilinea sp. LEGE 07298]|uniref:hypothetical protein n=1 Tax=Nodosilinea sp. LEGE 07298 TaxID=2777970 RepID=UPI00187DEDD3|nr:hypothetical protein [Nodosilinea sp. LEGE 07298]MBE9112798.1 hypothetical protein [Nodosilinea sp. LEGE 07298]
MTTTLKPDRNRELNRFQTAFKHLLKKLHQFYPYRRYRIYIGWFGGIQIHPR